MAALEIRKDRKPIVLRKLAKETDGARVARCILAGPVVEAAGLSAYTLQKARPRILPGRGADRPEGPRLPCLVKARRGSAQERHEVAVV